MIRPKLSLRRPLAVVGAALAGLTAAVALSSPASAHHPIVSGKTICDTETGKWTVEWTVTNSESDLVGEVSEVTLTPAGSTLEKIVVGAELPKSVDGALTDKQVLAADATNAQLTVTVGWVRDGRPISASATGSVSFDGTCTPATSQPSAKFGSDCEGVTVTLINAKEATKAARFTVTGDGGFTQSVEVKPGEEGKTVKVPAKSAGNITVTESGKKVDEYKWNKPKDCTAPDEVKGLYEATCDELIFTVENPKTGETVKATFTPNKGKVQTLVVEPGKTGTVKFKGEKGLTVTPAIEGYPEAKAISWDKEKPKNCPTPAPGGNGGGDTLPVTGAAAGTIAGGAALLLIVGGVLFFVARRRKVTFTA